MKIMTFFSCFIRSKSIASCKYVIIKRQKNIALYPEKLQL